MILLSHPTANQNVRQTALALAEAGLLEEFWTCVNWKPEGILDRAMVVAPRIRTELRRRSFARELTPFIRTLAWRELGRHAASQLGWTWLTRHEAGPLSVDAVYRALDRHVAARLTKKAGVNVIYGYDGGAVESFRAAKARGIQCLYEHPIVHWRKVRQLQRDEAELHPEWAPTLGALIDSPAKLAQKDEELKLADLIVTPSTFAKDSLSDAPGVTAPIRVLPYGTVRPSPSQPRPAAAKLRVIFVGALSQAKGLGYLLQAVARLDREVDLTLIGKRVSPLIPVPALLDKYRWIPSLPHDELLDEMSRHDALVLPSLHEGFGMVMTEAMAQGLVVITTPHGAGPDLILDGADGFIVPIRSADAIEEKLALLSRDREGLGAMQEAARRKAAACSWEVYRREVVRVAREVMNRETAS